MASEAVQSSVRRKTATLGTQTVMGAALAGALPSGSQPRPRGSIRLALARATARETEAQPQERQRQLPAKP